MAARVMAASSSRMAPLARTFSATANAPATPAAVVTPTLSKFPPKFPQIRLPDGSQPENHVEFEEMYKQHLKGEYAGYTGNPYLLAHVQTVSLPQTHGVLVGRLQFRSYSTVGLEFFVDFARRVAHALGIPCSGMARLPQKTEKETVLKGPFVHKKTQVNYWRRTYSRALAVYDADEELVRRWHAYLRKHQFPGIGMKAQIYTYEELGWLDNLPEAMRPKTTDEKIMDQVNELIPQLEKEAGLSSKSKDVKKSTVTSTPSKPIKAPITPLAPSSTELSPFESAPGGWWDTDGQFVPDDVNLNNIPGYTKAKEGLLAHYRNEGKAGKLRTMENMDPESIIRSDDLAPEELVSPAYREELLERYTNTLLSAPESKTPSLGAPKDKGVDGSTEFDFPEFNPIHLARSMNTFKTEMEAYNAQEEKKPEDEPAFRPFSQLSELRGTDFTLDQLSEDIYMPEVKHPSARQIKDMTDAGPNEIKEVMDQFETYEKLRKIHNEGHLPMGRRMTMRQALRDFKREIGEEEHKYPWQDEEDDREYGNEPPQELGEQKDKKTGKVVLREDGGSDPLGEI